MKGILPPLALDLASVTLGAVGLALFALPVLGVPLALIGLMLGLLAFLGARRFAALDIRLAAIGVAVCSVAVIIDVAMFYSPEGIFGPHQQSQMVSDSPAHLRNYVPPPAPFRRR